MNLFLPRTPARGLVACGAIIKSNSVTGRGSFLDFLVEGNSDHVFCVNSEVETY